MTILIIGSNKSGAIELYYHKYLMETNAKVSIFPLPVLADQSIRMYFYKKVFRHLGFSFIYRKFNKMIIEEIQKKRPDIVWIFKGVEVLPEILKTIRSMGVKLVNYNPDHPFLRTFASHGGKNIELSVPLYDLHFCYSHELSSMIKQSFRIPTVYLPFGFELDEGIYNNIKGIEEINKVAFIGNPDKERSRIIRMLATYNIPVDVYGYGWHQWLKTDDIIKVYDGVLGQEFWKTARKYRVNINIFRPHNIGSHNMRTFEIPACGGIMLAPYSKEHIAFFEDGQEIFTYKDDKTLIEQCRYIMNLTSDEANNIRSNARNKSIEADYTYKKNSEIVFQSFQDLIQAY